MSITWPTGSELIDALAPPFTAHRRSGDNARGISIRHPLVRRPLLVCHIHVDSKTDQVTGFYFNCQKSQERSHAIAGKLKPKMRWRPDVKITGPSPYMTVDFVSPPTLGELLDLVERSLQAHPYLRGSATTAA